jgi:hypothetical protein
MGDNEFRARRNLKLCRYWIGRQLQDQTDFVDIEGTFLHLLISLFYCRILN